MNAKLFGGGIISSSQRVVGLDVLRIALALLIYMFHSRMHMGCSYSYLNPFVTVGAIAMTGFFMLSGYSLRLVYGEQNLTEKKNLLRFYLKRLIGILPLYYVVALMYIVLMGEETLSENLLLLPIEALGLQSTFTSLAHNTHNGGTWFISCLLVAYLVYPSLQTVCKMLNVRQKVIALVALIIIELWSVIVSRYFDTANLYDNPFYRIIEFACGLIVADINIESNHRIANLLRSKWVLILSVIILVGGVSIVRYFTRIDDYMQYNWIVLPCFVAILFALGVLRFPKLENIKTISYLGRVSYAFFLVQFFAWPFGRWIIDLIGYSSNGFMIFITFTFCVLASVLLYELAQRPIDTYLRPKLLR